MKICIATGTRAEYGLLKPLMSAISLEKKWELQVLVTGAHLSPEFGSTYKIIEEDGFRINKRVEMLLSSDTGSGVVKSMGIGMIGFSDSLKELNPDFLLVLGDRYEMLAIASSALILNIPIIHINGGDVTEGAYDDAIRHSITKMSHIHFASTEEYKNRIIQLGENPKNVYNVGAIGLDNIRDLPLLNKQELEDNLSIRFKKYNYKIAFHPVTLESESSENQFMELLKALDKLDESLFIFTKSNADTGGRAINQLIDDYVSENPEKAVVFSSLGNLRFLSIVKFCDAIIGNSSSAIIEAPSLKTASINIGNRQKGRIQAGTVLNCKPIEKNILEALEIVKQNEFKQQISTSINPYGDGKTTHKIIEILKGIDLEEFKTKPFFDLKF